MKPKVTVLMPVYNGVRFLGRAIESVLCQTESDFELIIINDGSTEPVLKKIESYLDPRISLHTRAKNKGLTVRLNEGLMFAKGDFIARMDADDISMPQRLDLQLAAFEKGVGFVGCWGRSINESGDFIQHYVDTDCRCSNEDLKTVYPTKLCMIDASVIYSKEVIHKIGFYDTKVFNGESYNYTRRAQQFFEGRVIQEILYVRTVRHDSVMRQIEHDQTINVIELANQRARDFPVIRTRQ